MENDNAIKLAILLRNIARWALLIMSLVVGGFALISGAEEYGSDVDGIISNGQNAIPWLALLILTIIAWRNQILGGFLIAILGIWMVYFFNFSGPNFFLLTFILTTSIIFLGMLLVISGYALKSSYRY